MYLQKCTTNTEAWGTISVHGPAFSRAFSLGKACAKNGGGCSGWFGSTLTEIKKSRNEFNEVDEALLRRQVSKNLGLVWNRSVSFV